MNGDPLTTVLSRLGRHGEVRKAGSGYMARCPAHRDSNPSLKIDLTQDGKVLLKCFAGCSVTSILERLDLQMSDLFRCEDKVEEHCAPAPGQIITTYDYRDADGTLLYQVVRKHPKGFVQRRPDGSGGWVWETRDVKRVLFRLPELLAVGSEQTVYIAEGEKDVNSLVGLGLVATCNSGGAGKWEESYSESLRGRNCVILPDNDEPGRKHAEKVARMLQGYAASVRILALPELPDSGDISDWIRAGGTGGELKSLADKTPVVDFSGFSSFSNNGKERNEKKEKVGGFNFSTIEELLAEPQKEVEYLVADLLPVGGVSLIAAKPKVGKTTTVRQLCLSVARGEPFLGRTTKQGPVVYLALEEMRPGVASHFRDMGAQDEMVHIHVGAAPQEPLAALAEAIEEQKAALTVVDPLLRFIRVKDLNDYAEVTRALEPLVELARNSGCHILCIHHMNKADRIGGDTGDSILGSTALFGAVDTLMIMRKRDETRTLESVQRYGPSMPATVLVMDPTSRNIEVGGDFESMQLQDTGKQILQILADGPQTEAEIRERVGGNTALTGKALRKLKSDDLVLRSGGGRRGDPYVYSLASHDSKAA